MSREDERKVIGYADEGKLRDDHKPIDTLVSEMKAAAAAATGGNWRAQGQYVDAGHGFNGVFICEVNTSPNDAAYIVAVQPDNVLTLLAEIERLRPKAEMHDRAVATGWQEVDDKATISSLSTKLVELEQEIERIQVGFNMASDSREYFFRQTKDAEAKLAESEAREAAAVEKFAAEVVAETVRYARCYQPGTDGHNTFHLLADRIGALAALTLKGRS